MSSKTKILLIIDYDPSHNWYELFERITLDDGSSIEVHQTQWAEMQCNVTQEGLFVDIQPADSPIYGTNQKNQRTVQPDFVLIRNFARAVHEQSFMHNVLAFIHAGIPAVNSFESIYSCMEKPVVYGAMRAIQRKLGKDDDGNWVFPLIPQNFYPNEAAGTGMPFKMPSTPAVIKVGSTHAGYGKMRVLNDDDYMDLQSILVLHNDYFTTESFISSSHDVRLQRISSNLDGAEVHYRVFNKISDNNWKGNWGNIRYEQVEVTAWHKLIADECAALFGGLEILALDLVHDTSTDRDVIIELNDTAIGLFHEAEEEDTGYIVQAVIEKWNAHNAEFPDDSTSTFVSASSSSSTTTTTASKENPVPKAEVLLDENGIPLPPPLPSNQTENDE